jgi:DNA-binding LacI/PurR family transcriptional regulator
VPTPTSRPPTLEDVAARAGVSRALVSIVMRDVAGASDVTRARVRAVADELGYRPDTRARLLAGRRSHLLGVALSLRNPFHADVAEAVYGPAEEQGYQVVLAAITGARTARSALDTLASYRCEAVIVLGTLTRRDALGDLAERQPVIVVGQPSTNPLVDTVRAADSEGVGLAVEHLAGLGHRRIVHLDGGRAPSAGARRRGYRAAMRRVGLAAEIRIVPGGEREQDGAEAARALHDADLRGEALPDAVITYNDRSAVGLLDVLARLGVDVPGQLSVVGYDDSHIARLPYFRLTTVSQDPERLAALAVGRAVERIAGGSPTERGIVLTPRLVVRGTTAAR